MISALYWISSSEVFLKEVAVNIQHCAVIKNEEQCSTFRFIIAKCSQGGIYTRLHLLLFLTELPTNSKSGYPYSTLGTRS